MGWRQTDRQTDRQTEKKENRAWMRQQQEESRNTKREIDEREREGACLIVQPSIILSWQMEVVTLEVTFHSVRHVH